MEGAERAAILLLGIGEENAAEILKKMEPKTVQKVGKAMTTMANVTQSQIDSVVEEFIGAIEQQTSLGANAEVYVRRSLTAALGEEKATPFIDRILQANEETGLDTLKWLEARTVVDLIRNEHPQVIATILTTLDSAQAAEVLSCFSEERRVDLLLRMSCIKSVKPEALAKLGEVIEEQLNGQKHSKTASIGGIKSVADLINHLDGSIEGQVIDGIKDYDNDLSEQIQEQMFIFENLMDMDGRAIQTILREVSSDVLMLALKGADEPMKEKIFSNMSKRAAELMRDDLEAKGPVKVSEVETAQKEILSAARKLGDAGEISLGGRGSEEMI